MGKIIAARRGLWLYLPAVIVAGKLGAVMERCRLHVLYSGQVQGVGFRYAARSVARGFDVTGTIRNLPDGRVELVAEGARGELEAFCQGIREAGLGALIRKEDLAWQPAAGGFRGFEIVG
jgi:acylphosphatase